MKVAFGAVAAIMAGVFALPAQAALPQNPWLADSPWPITHQHPYAPGGSPYAGPTSAASLGNPQHVDTGLVNITLAMSPQYSNGNRVYWGSNISSVYKLAVVNGKLTKLASINKPGNALGSLKTPTNGAYTLVDRQNTFYTVQGTNILAYRDSQAGNINSSIVLSKQITLPSSLVSSDDAIVGLNLLWDGNLAFATRKGVVGVVSPTTQVVKGLVLGDGSEEVSNSIAADENGGIYVVSSKAMYRVQSTGGNVSLNPSTGAWRAIYNTGSATSGTGSGRLGAGSGSTPTVMGTNGQRFVVITDGADVANLVLLWRDAIPADWQPIAPGKDRRIAAELPVNFGDPARKVTRSEQSVLVSGYGAIVVSNDYRNLGLLGNSTGNAVIDQLANGIIVFNSGSIINQPWGVQKFDWDVNSRKLRSSWVRNDVSCPNSIPTMSESSYRFYCVGAYLGQWTIEALDWNSGGSHFRKNLGILPRFNSFYASTQLTGDGGIIYGSYNGAVYVPAVSATAAAAPKIQIPIVSNVVAAAVSNPNPGPIVSFLKKLFSW